MSAQRAMVSFVVPAHNEAAEIVATLEAIGRAATEAGVASVEVVVAADACADATAELARAAGARVIEVELRHIAATRNAGARAATGDRLIFVDADTRIDGAVVRAALDAMESGVAAGGARIRVDRRLPLWARGLFVVTAWWLYSTGRSGGCFLFCTREVFDAVGGFDEELYATEELAFLDSARRHGRVRIVRAHVVTSGRKLEAHSMGELVRTWWRVMLGRGRSVRRREGLDVWYRSPR